MQMEHPLLLIGRKVESISTRGEENWGNLIFVFLSFPPFCLSLS